MTARGSISPLESRKAGLQRLRARQGDSPVNHRAWKTALRALPLLLLGVVLWREKP